MVNNSADLIKSYLDYTDKYFLRSKQILQAEAINPIVRYQIFARQDIPSLSGINEATYFIKGVAGNKVKIYSLKEGDFYNTGEPMMKLEGRVQDLIDLETVYLGILAGNITGSINGEINMTQVREKARAIVKAANEKPVHYFGARHFHPFLDEQIAGICFEEGFVGTSTDIGAKARNLKGGGTTPHALILSYAAYAHENNSYLNPTVEVARAFDKNMDKTIPRIILIDTFNREIDDSIITARRVPNLAGIRIDTCGENYSQRAQLTNLPKLNVDKEYIKGKGVKIPGVWALRRALDKEGFRNLEIVVSSGFNAEKTAAFITADQKYQELYEKPLFDIIGTGSIANPIMTTSDICAYFSEKQGKWISLSKSGRSEKSSERLEERK